MANARGQDGLYREVAAEYGAALQRLAHGYEADPERRSDLLQEIHIALWRSFAIFDGRCSLRTWIYRVAHNTAASHVGRERRARRASLVTVDELASLPANEDQERAVDRQVTLERIGALVRQLKPLDRQVILSYLEGFDAAAIADITGLSANNVATKIHRIKAILTRRFHQGVRDES